MITPALKYLKENNVKYELLEYEHKIKGAKFASESLNVPLEKMIKTIILKGSDNNYYISLMPGNKEISLKKAAKILNLKNIELANPAEAQRVTGYQVGGISPFGTRKKMKIIADTSIFFYSEIYINGGKRGYIIKIKTTDLEKLLKPVNTDISKL